ncbi:hypothetical protein [Pseudonocardia parietis]|uniref:Uncharacterized protein n=1 Tax=Pseudonocardia parietis TaxID=570936 RepID=A0ABS4W3A7_9PSEU|nr:hypothetical protein [Pseudonocardia parietis]MBP2370685.1 hypothetical protein [Pseudonocardia parietis]
MTSNLMSQVLDSIAADRAAERVRTRVDGAVDTLRGAPAEAEQVVDRLVRELHRIRTADLERLGTDWRDQQVEKAVADATAAADRLEQSATDSVRAIAEWTRGQSGPVDVNAALLSETRQTKAWNRQRAQLDAGVDALTLVQQAQAAGDHDAVLALRAEYGAYAAAAGQSRHVSDPAVVDRHLDEAVMATAPKGERGRLRVERDLATGAEGAELAVGSLRKQIDRYTSPGSSRALDHAVRVQDVRANAGVEGMAPAPQD